MKRLRIAVVLLLISMMGVNAQGCATARGALVGAVIGGLIGDAARGAQIGATAGLMVDIFR